MLISLHVALIFASFGIFYLAAREQDDPAYLWATISGGLWALNWFALDGGLLLGLALQGGLFLALTFRNMASKPRGGLTRAPRPPGPPGPS